ncbi:hypothetical protein LWF01_18720 [Saxibacter everestensis]|uniref:DUF4190 domain-containing protein n=1 Tax=Saxibacter everestensis TaxID=2909229 RepID=A0ABY8QUP7_9MICO|nr:hypothetical protein LWF01_18720 [Brevibacteriaceae bacterium ZFBP1038]
MAGPWVPEPDHPAARHRNKIGELAVTPAVLGLILSFVPFVSFVAWFPLIAAIVLAVIALTKKNHREGHALVALVVAAIGVLVVGIPILV